MATKPKTLNDLKALHDPDTVIRGKIEAQIATMLKLGREEWDYEQDFIKKAGIAQSVIANYREQYAKYVAVTASLGPQRPRTVWFADPAVAKKFRGE